MLAIPNLLASGVFNLRVIADVDFRGDIILGIWDYHIIDDKLNIKQLKRNNIIFKSEDFNIVQILKQNRGIVSTGNILRHNV